MAFSKWNSTKENRSGLEVILTVTWKQSELVLRRVSILLVLKAFSDYGLLEFAICQSKD